MPFSLMKRPSARMLTTPVPNCSPDWNSWRDSGERTGCFISRSIILFWGAVTIGFRHQTQLHQAPLKDISQYIWITSSEVVVNLGEDSDFATRRRPSSVTPQLQIVGGCVLVVRVHTKIQIQFLDLGKRLQQRWSFI